MFHPKTSKFIIKRTNLGFYNFFFHLWKCGQLCSWPDRYPGDGSSDPSPQADQPKLPVYGGQTMWHALVSVLVSNCYLLSSLGLQVCFDLKKKIIYILFVYLFNALFHFYECLVHENRPQPKDDATTVHLKIISIKLSVAQHSPVVKVFE